MKSHAIQDEHIVNIAKQLAARLADPPCAEVPCHVPILPTAGTWVQWQHKMNNASRLEYNKQCTALVDVKSSVQSLKQGS